VGYDHYDRAHRVTCPPATDPLPLSSDPAFRGDPSRMNPESLQLAAASSCQLLSFLAVAARARVDVLAYDDEAEADMPEDDQPVRITAIRLRPRITVAAGTDEARVHKLVDLAHQECYIANSLTSEMDIRATVEVAPASPR
jgi:organic hydroperoxide reductase OsmC/OhrA